MLGANLKLLTRVPFGCCFISSRGNYLLPPTAKLYILPSSSVCSSSIVGLPVPYAILTDLLPQIRHLVSCITPYVPAVGVLQLGSRQHLHFALDSRHLCSNPNHILTMPELKKNKRSGSFKDLIMGKKKNKNKKDTEVEESADVGLTEEPKSLDSTGSEVASADADGTIAEGVEPENLENGTKDEEEAEKAADEEEQEAAEPEEETPTAAAEPEEEEPAGSDGGVALETVLTKLENFAPLNLAADWDNVGLLVEPKSEFVVRKIFLTNDLTEGVLEEAIASNSNFILSYHPPIFSPLKRLTMKTEKERIIVKAIGKEIAIYSPHTAHDAARGGVNDWLISAFGNRDASAILCSSNVGPKKFKLEISVGKPFKQNVLELFAAKNGSPSKAEKMSDGSYHFKAICDESTLTSIISSLNDKNVKRTTQIIELFPDPCNNTGFGRFVTLLEPFSVETCIAKVKAHLELEHVQLALGEGKTLESSIETIAVCAGSGGKVLEGTKADLYLTGEMSHHEVLAAVSKGTCVITCNHSNTERGYLKALKEKLETWLGKDIPVQVSEVDADPLKVI